MKKLYLFSYTSEEKVSDLGEKKVAILILFCPYKNIDKHLGDIYNQLRLHFQRNVLPDKIIVICASFNESELTSLFALGSNLYDYIPLFKLDRNFSNISINSLQKTGTFKTKMGFNVTDYYLKNIFNRGMVRIFKENGGLIISQSAHHFVFPSGKHSDRFLRPGNVLLEGLHIQFIAFAIFNHFSGKKFANIYCDTSSINSVAYAINALTREFYPSFRSSLLIESFGSYEGFEKAKLNAPKDCMFLISSSTSGGIINRMLVEDKKKIISEENICILYALDVDIRYSSRIICDLTKENTENPEGLEPFESYNVNKGELCKFCDDNSRAVPVKGDVFLLEKPIIKGLTIYKSDHSKTLRNFSEYFKKGTNKETLITAFFKEDSQDGKKYEIYIDIEKLLNEWDSRNPNHPFEKIYSKLEKYIYQNIPASLKYMIVVPDKSSLLLAKIIIKVLSNLGITFEEENILSIGNISRIDKSLSGTIAVISSSIATGRNLLFISRALRQFESEYQHIYFTLINRTSNLKHYDFLESNLGFGEFGKGTHKIINVEKILCPHEAYDTPWHIEKEALKLLREYCETEEIFPIAIEYCNKRINELEDSGLHNGLADNLFLNSITNKKLKINKGFAFAPDDPNFITNSTQADIYFIIGSILNEIRASGRLDQSEYVRNVLEPGNFVRYNDGIIQAAILRSAKYDELRYDLSDSLSLQIEAILEDMIDHIEDEHAEALIEFFYAISIKKLRLTNASLNACILLIRKKDAYSRNQFLQAIIQFIDVKILKKDRRSTSLLRSVV